MAVAVASGATVSLPQVVDAGVGALVEELHGYRRAGHLEVGLDDHELSARQVAW